MELNQPMDPSKTIHVTTASDLNMAACLHPMLLSTMAHLAPDASCVFHLYLKDFSPADVALIEVTLHDYRERVELRIKDVNAINLGTGKGISGNRMCYTLFAALNQSVSDYIIWVDADMIVLADLLEVWLKRKESDSIAMVVARKNLAYAHPMERSLMHKYGMKDDDPFFNSAFVAVDSIRYNALNGFEKNLEFIEKHPEQGDQGAVNQLFMGDLELLEHKYNTPYWPTNSTPDLNPADQVCHFIGSPKPWDLFGNLLHPSYPIFEKWMERTAYRTKYRRRYFKVSAWQRALRISYKYWPLLKAKIRA